VAHRATGATRGGVYVRIVGNIRLARGMML
jgi:hypothetical protein